MNAEEYQAWLDLAGLALPLIGAALITLVGIPDLVWAPLVLSDHGPPGNLPLIEADPANVAARVHYFQWAGTGMVLATLGTGIQARKAFKIVFARAMAWFRAS